jgi:hypothetical protein
MASINLRHSLGTTRSLNHAQVLEQPPAAYKEVTSPQDSKCLPIATQSSSPTWDATAVRFRIPIFGSVRDVASHKTANDVENVLTQQSVALSNTALTIF